MTILILHGIGGHAGIHWQQWLANELRKRGQTVIMPELSNTQHPDRRQWLDEINQALTGVDPSELIVVGHSLGATIALDFIETSNTPIKAFVSVSGFGIDYGAELNSYFMQQKTIDFGLVRAHIGSSGVFYSDNDPYVPQGILKELAAVLDVNPTVVHAGGHLNAEAGYTKFPQLLEAVLSYIPAT